MDADIVVMVQKHENDLYRGNGKPGLTTRVALTEEKIDKVAQSFSQIVLMVATILLTLLADLLFHVFTRAH